MYIHKSSYIYSYLQCSQELYLQYIRKHSNQLWARELSSISVRLQIPGIHQGLHKPIQDPKFALKSSDHDPKAWLLSEGSFTPQMQSLSLHKDEFYPGPK